MAKGFPDLLRCDPFRLIEQRNAAALAAELVEGAKKVIPARFRSGDRIDCHDRTVIRIGEKRTLILRDPIADAEHVAAVVMVSIVSAAERTIIPENNCIIRLWKGP